MATVELGVLIKTAVAGAGYGAFAELGHNIDRLKAKTEHARAAQARLGETIAQLGRQGRDIDGVSEAHRRLGEAIAAAERRANALHAAMQRQADHRQRLGALWGEAVGVVGLGMTLAAPMRQAIAFESAMADVRKVVDGTDAQIDALGQTIQAMSRRIPLASTELAAMAAAAGQLGVRLGEIPAFVETTAKMAVAFDMPAEEAGDAMAKLANVFGIPISEIARLGDAINQISNESPAKAAEVVRALSRVGGVSKAFGLAARDAAALASAFIAMGKPPEVAGTAINALLTKLATAPKQNRAFQEGLAALGLSAQQLKGHIDRDARGALDDFLARLAKVPKEQRMSVLVDLFGLEYADDIAALAGSLEVYRAQQAAASRAEGSMSREFAARAATTANNLQLLRNQLAELGVNIGSALLPALNSVVAGIRPVIEAFADFARANPALVAGIGKVAAALLAFKAGSLAARAGYHLIAGSVWGLIGRLRALGVALSTVQVALATRSAMPLLDALQGAAPAAGGLLLRLKEIANSGAPMRALGWHLRTIGAQAATSAVAVGGTLKGALLSAGRALLWLGRAAMTNPIGLALTAAAALVYKYWEPISGFFEGLWSGLKAGLAPIGASIEAAFAPLAPVLRPIGDLLSRVGGWFRALVKPAEDAGGAAEAFGVRVGTAIGNAVRMFLSLPGKLLALPKEMTRLGGEIVSGLIGGIKAKLAAAGEAIAGLGETIKAKFKGWLGIRSPSRVFAGFGQAIGLGAAQGIAGMGAAVARASAGLALAATTAFNPALAADLPPPDEAPAAGSPAFQATIRKVGAGGTAPQAAPMTINFAPAIHVTVAPGGDVKAQVQEATRLSFAEFERFMRRYEAERRRLSPMGGLS